MRIISSQKHGTGALRSKSAPVLFGASSADERVLVSADETVYFNEAYIGATASLSIGSPYYRDDPTQLIQTLARDRRAAEVELVIVDDGTGDSALDQRVRGAIDAWPGPAILVRFHTNKGRAQARNRAIKAARGAYLLFVDADMLPGNDQFLSRYFDKIDQRAAAIIFGGFTTLGVIADRDTQLNYSLALKNDCKSARERSLRGPISVASNNLLVRRDVFDAEPFDSAFKGWGWEDTEWALRAVHAGFGLIHIDNPAMHVGLDSSRSMLRKYKEAGANLRRLLDKHPEGERMTGVRVARALAGIPFHDLLRPVCAWVALDHLGVIPIQIRRLAMKYWRASHAAQALQAD